MHFAEEEEECKHNAEVLTSIITINIDRVLTRNAINKDNIRVLTPTAIINTEVLTQTITNNNNDNSNKDTMVQGMVTTIVVDTGTIVVDSEMEDGILDVLVVDEEINTITLIPIMKVVDVINIIIIFI